MDTVRVENDHEKALKVIDYVNEVIKSDKLTWEDKYNLCFDFVNESKIRKWSLWPDYYDPDCDYQDDVLALYNALQAVRPKAVEMIRISNSSNEPTD